MRVNYIGSTIFIFSHVPRCQEIQSRQLALYYCILVFCFRFCLFFLFLLLFKKPGIEAEGGVCVIETVRMEEGRRRLMLICLVRLTRGAKPT